MLDVDDFRPFRGNVFQTKVLNNEGLVDLKNFQVEYDVRGMKEFLNEFERVRYQRISAEKHDPNDTIIATGVMKTNESKNPVNRGYAPDPYYVSHDFQKDSIELVILGRINTVLDKAKSIKNEQSIVLADGKTIRPDKVFILEELVIVLDFKFTAKDEKQHLKQVSSYIQALELLGYSQVEGYIFYTKTNQIKKV